MSANRLTTRQRKFVDLYEGNATKAAILAGYSKKTAYRTGADNIKKPQIMKALLEREKKETGPLIANRIARQQFWTQVFKDSTVEMKDRLKASELLGKSEADFSERVLHDITEGLAEQLKQARERVRRACESSQASPVGKDECSEEGLNIKPMVEVRQNLVRQEK